MNKAIVSIYGVTERKTLSERVEENVRITGLSYRNSVEKVSKLISVDFRNSLEHTELNRLMRRFFEGGDHDDLKIRKQKTTLSFKCS